MVYHPPFVSEVADSNVCETAAEALRKAERLLYSIRDVLEKETGLDGALFSDHWYTPQQYNPHRNESQQAA